jgi:hypothetical protein
VPFTVSAAELHSAPHIIRCSVIYVEKTAELPEGATCRKQAAAAQLCAASVGPAALFLNMPISPTVTNPTSCKQQVAAAQCQLKHCVQHAGSLKFQSTSSTAKVQPFQGHGRAPTTNTCYSA